jgi:hypothetical protein
MIRLEVLLIGALSCATAVAPKRGSAVIEIRRQINLSRSEKVSIPAIAIQDIDLRLPLPPATANAGSCIRQYCNDGMNSRLPAASPAKTLEVRWAVPFTPSFQPDTVLQAGDHVLAYGGTAFRVYDLDGKMISEGRTGSSGMVLDAEQASFYFIGSSGYLATHRLSDGGVEYKLNPATGDAWTFLARRAKATFNLSVELPKPWRKEPPKKASLNRIDLPDTLQLDNGKVVLELTSATLQLGTPTVKPAMAGDRLVLAMPGEIVLSPATLQPDASLTGDFIPQTLSLDELGRIHVVVRTGDQTALWVLTPAGQRTAKVVFKPEYGAPFGPPIIGYDHHIFLLHSGITAYDAYGELLWERWLKGRVAGAGITTDGQLLVSGGDLAAYDEKGERRLLFMLPGVSFVTPPAMSAKGEIFVASKDTVYCLAPKKE